MRSLAEWIGKNDDHQPPPHVQLRVLVHYDARCASCTRPIGGPDKWQLDHINPICAGGRNVESNLQPLCETCHIKKTAREITEKSIAYHSLLKHLSIKPKQRYRPIIGSKRSGWKKLFDGTLIRRK